MLLVGVGVFVATRSTADTTTPFTLAEVSQRNGKNGNKCYVAVDGKVYDLSAVNDWLGGVHKKSEGKAMCGMEGSEVIKQSPHGKSKLNFVPQVGIIK